MSIPTIKREIFSVLLKVLAVVLTIILTVVFFSFTYSNLGMISDGECNIAVLPIEGVIMPFGSGVDYGEMVITPKDVREFITTAESESAIKGIMFEVNSPGGTPVASETINTLINEISLPTMALIGDIGASGAYMVASAADTVIASAMSDVGGIGVTMSYLEESKKNEDEGLTFVELATGKFKDMGNPNRVLNTEERTLLESQLAIVHEKFVEIVANNRQLDVAVVKELADGSTLVGNQALLAKLVDKIGGRAEVRETFATKLAIPAEEVKFCENYSLLKKL